MCIYQDDFLSAKTVLTGANKTQLHHAQDKPPTIRFLMRPEKTERSRPVKQHEPRS